MFTLEILTECLRHLLHNLKDFGLFQLTKNYGSEIDGVISLARFDNADDNVRYVGGVVEIVSAIRAGKQFTVEVK